MPVLAAAVLAGCGQKVESPANPYCPLNSGRTWAYTVATTGAGRTPIQARMESKINGYKTVNGNRYAVLVNRTTGGGRDETETVYLRSTPKGVYFLKGFETDEPEQLYLPADPKAGQTWTVKSSTSSIENRVEGFETLDIMGAKYACVKISARGTVKAGPEGVMISGITYYAKGVGQVKSQMTIMGEGGERVPTNIIMVEHSD